MPLSQCISVRECPLWMGTGSELPSAKGLWHTFSLRIILHYVQDEPRDDELGAQRRWHASQRGASLPLWPGAMARLLWRGLLDTAPQVC